mmetsp:Transcript_71688/g.202695  ORF Transcript_71688/g.202695 Transcript_71688/m.202695 type:complete len:159 (-) Transcript_71688:551-1027(-)
MSPDACRCNPSSAHRSARTPPLSHYPPHQHHNRANTTPTDTGALAAAELKHGRISQLAIVGFLVEEKFHLPMFSKISSNPLDAGPFSRPRPPIQPHHPITTPHNDHRHRLSCHARTRESTTATAGLLPMDPWTHCSLCHALHHANATHQRHTPPRPLS